MEYIKLDSQGSYDQATIEQGFVLMHMASNDNGIVITVKNSSGTVGVVIDPRFNGIETALNGIGGAQ